MDREQILSRFTAWLDSVLAEEEPPQGIAAEVLAALDAGPQDGSPAPTATATPPGRIDGQWDLYSMWSAMTALTQEVKLQGRSFKQLSETVAPVAELAPLLPEMQRQADERARGEVLDVLLDLRDRLRRGLDSARAGQVELRKSFDLGWRSRLFGLDKPLEAAVDAVAALEKGYSLSLERLNEVLDQSHVREIECQGQPFDPTSMHAVDLEETSGAPEGTVLEVYRAGYEWKGEVYRPAQVRVARRPSAVAAGAAAQAAAGAAAGDEHE
ncbi:MAG TPA: nucleotide exchange factor GrpE [Terriglobia bacterium]|nr:nucleotide exchange factor GrpE [Terriglobia bacterium]